MRGDELDVFCLRALVFPLMYAPAAVIFLKSLLISSGAALFTILDTLRYLFELLYRSRSRTSSTCLAGARSLSVMLEVGERLSVIGLSASGDILNAIAPAM